MTNFSSSSQVTAFHPSTHVFLPSLFVILWHHQKKRKKMREKRKKITFIIEWDEKFLNIKSLHTISSFFSTSHSLLRFLLIFCYFEGPFFVFHPSFQKHLIHSILLYGDLFNYIEYEHRKLVANVIRMWLYWAFLYWFNPELKVDSDFEF